MEVKPNAAQVRDTLRAILAAHLAGKSEPLGESEVYALCEKVGVWPVPPTHSTRVSALRLFAARALPLFNPEGPPLTPEDQLMARNFAHWRRYLEDGDTRSLRACTILMKLWCRGDSLSLGSQF